MIGAVSAYGGYTGVQRPSYGVPTRSNTFTAAENPSVVAVHRASSPEVPVQPVDAATPVTAEVSGNLNIDLSVRNSADVTEMAVRMRISPAESGEATEPASFPGTREPEAAAENAAQEREASGVNAEDAPQAQETGAQSGRVEESSAASEEAQDKLAAEEAQRQARLEERAQLEKEAEAQREAYLESLAETEQTRSERVEALREAQAAKGESPEDRENEEGEETRQAGSLQLDYTASLLQNYQMTNLLRSQISARMNGEDTSNYNAALDSILQNGQDRIRFTNGSEADSNSAARQAHQQRVNESPFGIVA